MRAVGEGHDAGLQDKMDMIGHRTEGVNTIPEAASSLLKQEIESIAIAIAEEDRLTGIAPENNVIESTGKIEAWFVCHGFNNTPEAQTC